MVGKVQLPLPVELYEPPYSKAPPQDAVNEPLPLESCLITVVPLNGVVPLYAKYQNFKYRDLIPEDVKKIRNSGAIYIVL